MAAFLVVVTLLLAGGFCTWVYYRREFAVRSRALLLAARLVAVAGVLALLWNPVVPAAPHRAAPDRYAVLDASASMGARSPGGDVIWESAVRRARALAENGARLLVAGAAVHAVDADSLSGIAPSDVESVLAEAVAVAAEAGARQVILVTDRRLRDPVATSAAARRLGVSLTVDTLLQAGDNLGLGRLVLPASAAAGEEVRGRVEVEGTTGADSVPVVVSIDGEPWRTLRLASPAGGGTSSADFNLGNALAAGPHYVTVRLSEPDAFPLDDERTAVVLVDPEETGVLLVSFAPDWEPRFLLPVLGQVTGLPVRGFFRTGAGRYHPMNAAAAGNTAAIGQAAMGRLLRRAEMVVAMGVDGSTVEFLEDATSHTPHLLVFPLDGAGAAGGGVAAGGALAGEWYLHEAPPSPIAGEVERFAGAGLPPLTRVLPVTGEADGAALLLRLAGTGEDEAALVLRTDGSRRVGVVLAQGFWRWAFRGGVPREHYRRLWTAVGGWMMADEPVAAGPGVRPARPVLQGGMQVPWLAPGYENERIVLAVTAETGDVVLDSTLTIPPGGLFTTPPLGAGPYAYTATATADTIGGVFHVEAFTDEMLRLPTDAAELTVRTRDQAATAQASRPLRTWPFLYLLILGAVCAEWIGRRRAGLR